MLWRIIKPNADVPRARDPHALDGVSTEDRIECRRVLDVEHTGNRSDVHILRPRASIAADSGICTRCCRASRVLQHQNAIAARRVRSYVKGREWAHRADAHVARAGDPHALRRGAAAIAGLETQESC